MKNKARFKELLRSQPESDWAKNTYGTYFGTHCKLGWVMWKSFDRISELQTMEDFDLNRKQILHIIALNDSSKSGKEATEKIINYVNHLRNT